MAGRFDITEEHPLFQELRRDLWHCTSPDEYRQIRADGFIKPNDGRLNRWGAPYACQQLGGISLFDFETHPAEKVLGEVFKWGGFIYRARPVTVCIGVQRRTLIRRLVPYPDNKEGTTGNVIPWVEVCHCGPIPISAAGRFLLVCPVDLTRFHLVDGELTDERLTVIEDEFKPLVERYEKQVKEANDEMSRKFAADPEVQRRLAQVKRITAAAAERIGRTLPN